MFLKLLKFDDLVAPLIIKIVYYIGMTFSVLSGLGMIFAGVGMVSQGGPMASMGLLAILGGPVSAIFMILVNRIATELALVLFMMRDELAWNREFLQGQHANKKARATKTPDA